MPYTKEQKAEAIDLCQKYGSGEAHRRTGIPARTIRSWRGIKSESTMYRDGEPVIRWEKSSYDDSIEAIQEAIEAFKEELPRYKPIKPPRACESDLCAVYPVGDHHVGMLSWGEETGGDYDVDISERLLMGAFDNLVNSAPPAEQALIPFLGDFLHYDSFESVTPTAKNQLDTDTRFQKMVRVAVRLIRNAIKTVLTKHEKVRVVFEFGNHDLASTAWLAEFVKVLYEDEPRVSVDTSPSHFHYFKFGKCLIGTHHGHGTKMQNLPLIMATDRPKDWGDTEYRYFYTGHIHKSKVQPAVSAQDFSGCVVESFRILAPNDAWAHQKGYRSHQDMKCIILHKDFGEVGRNTVNPAMLG